MICTSGLLRLVLTGYLILGTNGQKPCLRSLPARALEIRLPPPVVGDAGLGLAGLPRDQESAIALRSCVARDKRQMLAGAMLQRCSCALKTTGTGANWSIGRRSMLHVSLFSSAPAPGTPAMIDFAGAV
ncbi:hypothetical protein V8C26DRAFT_407806 [Trichoderma gracile]